MRVILFFDLPTITETDRRIYAKFRKRLISNGYIMLQYSVYAKIFNNREAATNHISILKNKLPEKGYIRIMMVTEKQYSKMETLIGGKSLQEEYVTIKPFAVY